MRPEPRRPKLWGSELGYHRNSSNRLRYRHRFTIERTSRSVPSRWCQELFAEENNKTSTPRGCPTRLCAEAVERELCEAHGHCPFLYQTSIHVSSSPSAIPQSDYLLTAVQNFAICLCQASYWYQLSAHRLTVSSAHRLAVSYLLSR